MKIAIDKNSINLVKPNNDYIYLFDKEPLEELLNTGFIIATSISTLPFDFFLFTYRFLLVS